MQYATRQKAEDFNCQFDRSLCKCQGFATKVNCQRSNQVMKDYETKNKLSSKGVNHQVLIISNQVAKISVQETMVSLHVEINNANISRMTHLGSVKTSVLYLFFPHFPLAPTSSHRAVLRTICIIYRHEYDKNPFLSSFVVIMFLKSISVLGADMNGSDFKLGEPESIALKIVSSGLASHVKTVRVHTLAGLLYLVQSESLESFAQTIGVMSVYIEKFMRNIQTGAASSEVDETQFVVALLIKLLELPFRTKQDKKVLLKLALKTLRVRRERFILELIAEGIEQLLCRSNEFNLVITHVLLVALESGDPTPFPTDNEYYCRLVYRILMVIAIRAKVAKDDIVMARVYRALQKLGFDYLSRGEAAQALSRTLPFFSICVNGVENTIIRYIEAFIVNGEDKNRRFVTTLINQVIDTAGTSKKWSVELKTFRDALHSKSETLDVHNRWLLNLLNHKLID